MNEQSSVRAISMHSDVKAVYIDKNLSYTVIVKANKFVLVMKCDEHAVVSIPVVRHFRLDIEVDEEFTRFVGQAIVQERFYDDKAFTATLEDHIARCPSLKDSSDYLESIVLDIEASLGKRPSIPKSNRVAFDCKRRGNTYFCFIIPTGYCAGVVSSLFGVTPIVYNDAVLYKHKYYIVYCSCKSKEFNAVCYALNTVIERAADDNDVEYLNVCNDLLNMNVKDLRNHKYGVSL